MKVQDLKIGKKYIVPVGSRTQSGKLRAIINENQVIMSLLPGDHIFIKVDMVIPISVILCEKTW